MSYRAPVPLRRENDVSTFSCRSVEQTEWLRRYAHQSSASGLTKVYVVCPTGSDEVVAYYAWTMAQVDASDAPPRLLKGTGRYPQPVALLARLGVHRNHEGMGLGYGLLQDVLLRVAAISDEIGCRGLLIHAETQEARNFYLHLVPEFESSPTSDLHLYLLLKDVRRTLQGGAERA